VRDCELFVVVYETISLKKLLKIRQYEIDTWTVIKQYEKCNCSVAKTP